MPNCSKLRKNECNGPECIWIPNKGCRNINSVMSSSGLVTKTSGPDVKTSGLVTKTSSPVAKTSGPVAKTRKSTSKKLAVSTAIVSSPLVVPPVVPSVVPPVVPPPSTAQSITTSIVPRVSLQQSATENNILLPDGNTYGPLILIDYGTYGCVIQPPISDSVQIRDTIIPYTIRANNDIGKIFKSERYKYKSCKEACNRELKILLEVDKIDPNAIFTTKLKGVLEINGSAFETQQDIKRCINIKTKLADKKLFQIILENGGSSLQNPKITITYKKFLELFKQFLQGMLIFHSHKKIHRDIKPANVLISPTKISLIDFSLTCDVSDVYSYNGAPYLSAKYRFYPPEFYVLNQFVVYMNVHKDNPNSFKYYMKNEIKKMYEIMEKEKYFEQPHIQKDLNRYQKGIKKFISTIKDMQNIQELLTDDFIFKADVFPLSFVLSSLNNIIQHDNQTQKNFVEKLEKMCSEPNPFERPTIQELYDILLLEHAKYASPS